MLEMSTTYPLLGIHTAEAGGGRKELVVINRCGALARRYFIFKRQVVVAHKESSGA